MIFTRQSIWKVSKFLVTIVGFNHIGENVINHFTLLGFGEAVDKQTRARLQTD